jgi:uncharacterized protein
VQVAVVEVMAASPRAGEGSDLPALRQLDPRVRTAWRIGLMVRAVIFTLLSTLIPGSATGAPLLWAVPPLVAVGMGALVIYWPGLRYRHWAFRIRRDDIYVRHGVLWRTSSIVPHARVQHVDTERGPVERWLGLAKLIVFTAGVHGARTVIPGLDAEEAELLRDHLADLGTTDDAV